MPCCCILACSARKNKNQPQLTLHRFPKNEVLRLKWIQAIGEENINPRQKVWYLCSLHFEESCFNRTLDVTRLRENSVPTIFPVLAPKSAVLCEISNMTDVPSTSSVLHPPHVPQQALLLAQKEVILDKKVKVLEEKFVKQKKKIKSLSEKLRRKNKKIANLKDIIEDLREKNQINMEQAVLIKSIIKIFLDIRFRYHGRTSCEKVSHRQFLNKLILFRNE